MRSRTRKLNRARRRRENTRASRRSYSRSSSSRIPVVFSEKRSDDLHLVGCVTEGLHVPHQEEDLPGELVGWL
jgi:hypothetical protein